MAALLPLIGGVLLARFVASRSTVIGAEVVLYALAAAVLIATAPDNGHSYGAGVVMSLVLAALCVLAVVLGSLWRNRQATVHTV
jgi:peptidoglycan/LPS O-acetylase OafA/YrhL